MTENNTQAAGCLSHLTAELDTGIAMNLMLGDCLERMKEIPDGSVDLILTDPPYGTTACKWDTVIPLDAMWTQLNRIIKSNGAIALFSSQPFTSALVMSNPKYFKYEWIWKKTRFTGHLNATKMPLKAHENVMIFSKGVINYKPIKTLAPEDKIDKRKNVNPSFIKSGSTYNGSKEMINIRKKDDGTRYPTSVQEFKNPNNNNVHPTQKPIDLLEYLVKTYTNESELVLDFTAGSFSTGIACLNTNRKFIGFELDDKYYDIGKERLINHVINNESK